MQTSKPNKQSNISSNRSVNKNPNNMNSHPSPASYLLFLLFASYLLFLLFTSTIHPKSPTKTMPMYVQLQIQQLCQKKSRWHQQHFLRYEALLQQPLHQVFLGHLLSCLAIFSKSRHLLVEKTQKQQDLLKSTSNSKHTW